MYVCTYVYTLCSFYRLHCSAGGKRDEQLILPSNSSLSVTLDPAVMCATTSAAVSREFTCDRLWLNGRSAWASGLGSRLHLRYIREVTGVMYSVHWMLCREEDISSNPRLQKCLKEGEWTVSDVLYRSSCYGIHRTNVILSLLLRVSSTSL